MDIEKAKKVVKWLKQKEELENFFNSLQKLKDLKEVWINFDCIAGDGTAYPCFCKLSADIVLPCLKKELESVEMAIKNL